MIVFFKELKCLFQSIFSCSSCGHDGVSDSLLLKDTSAGWRVLDGGQALCLLCHLGGPNKQTCKDVEKADGKSSLSRQQTEGKRPLAGRFRARWSSGRAKWIDPSQTGCVVNAHWGLMGSLAVLLIVSLISCFLQITGKQAEQAEAIAFSLWGQKWKICNCFWYKDSRREWI